jgi:hypothetical protein
MGSAYYNRTSSGLPVALGDGSSGFVRSKGTLNVTEDQDNSADLVAKVRKKMLVRLGVPAVLAKTPTVEPESTPVAVPVEAPVNVPVVQQAKVLEEPVSEKEEESSVAVDPLGDFLDNHEESPDKSTSRRRGGKQRRSGRS